MRRLLLFGVLLLALLLAAFLASACNGPAHFAPSPLAPDVPREVTSLNLVVSPGELPVGGGSAVIRIETQAGTGIVAPNVPVTLSTDGGTLSRAEITTDVTGHAAVDWHGTKTAKVTGTAGSVTGSIDVRVLEPQVLPAPPPPVFPPPAPIPDPPPPPTPQPPALAVGLTPSAGTVAAGSTLTFTASVGNFQPGEVVTMYQWDLDGNGTHEFTTTAPTKTSGAYTGHGPMRAFVTVTTNQNRTGTGSTSFIVTN